VQLAGGRWCALSWLLPFALGPLVAGCGSQVPTVPLQGKVTWQGKPLTDGTVTFSPVKVAAGLPNRPASGELGPDGVYRLSSFRRGDGLLPGEYRVTVRSLLQWPNPDSDRPAVWRIPERYGDPARSGLRFTMPAGARAPLTFDIDIQP
jgi:hypothetical protein